MRRFGDEWSEKYIALVITLGAPHSPPEDVKECATRGVLAELERLDALKAPLIPVLTVAGDVVVDPALTGDSYVDSSSCGHARKYSQDATFSLTIGTTACAAPAPGNGSPATAFKAAWFTLEIRRLLTDPSHLPGQ